MNRAEFVAVVLGDADVMWAAITANVKIAGPWARGCGSDLGEGRTYRTGRTVAGGAWLTIASVWPVVRCKSGHDRSVNQQFCPVCGLGVATEMFVAQALGSEVTVSRRPEAESWCDQRLRDDGWLVANRTPTR